jgi:hypothetical protein
LPRRNSADEITFFGKTEVKYFFAEALNALNILNDFGNIVFSRKIYVVIPGQLVRARNVRRANDDVEDAAAATSAVGE